MNNNRAPDINRNVSVNIKRSLKESAVPYPSPLKRRPIVSRAISSLARNRRHICEFQALNFIAATQGRFVRSPHKLETQQSAQLNNNAVFRRWTLKLHKLWNHTHNTVRNIAIVIMSRLAFNYEGNVFIYWAICGFVILCFMFSGRKLAQQQSPIRSV